MGDDVAALAKLVEGLLLSQAQQEAAMAAMARAQEDTAQRLDQALSLLHGISRDMSALRGTTRVVVDANVGGGSGGGAGAESPLLSDHMAGGGSSARLARDVLPEGATLQGPRRSRLSSLVRGLSSVSTRVGHAVTAPCARGHASARALASAVRTLSQR